MTLDIFQWYLLIINVISFLLFSIDFFIYMRGGDGIKPAILCEIVTIFGGALGTTLAFFLWDRKSNKMNLTWRIFAITLLIIQVVIVAAIYGPHSVMVKQSISDFLNDNKWILIYLAMINLVTFIFFAVDKWKAMHGKWRIRILTLIGLAFAGGTIGGLAAMYLFRHKTTKPYFTFGLPMILLAQVVLLVYLKSTGII